MITTDFLLYWASCISEEEAPRTKSLVWRKSRERRRHAGAAHGYCVSLQRCHTSSDCLFQDVTQGSRSIFCLSVPGPQSSMFPSSKVWGGLFPICYAHTGTSHTSGQTWRAFKVCWFCIRMPGLATWSAGWRRHTKGKPGTNLIQMLSFNARMQWCCGRQYFTARKKQHQWVSIIVLSQLSMSFWPVTVGFL